MNVTSTIFLFLFLPIALLGCFVIKPAMHNAWLLILSLLFYAWGGPRFFLLLVALIVVVYLLGLWQQNTAAGAGKKAILLLSVVINLAVLGYFKYLNFFVSVLPESVRGDFNIAQAALPLGISFFVFKMISYGIDVYRGTVPAERNLANLALYVSFFPQVISGPISRYSDFGPQLKQREMSWSGYAEGAERIVFGLAKKVIISDTVALIANTVFGMEAPMGAVAWLGSLAYTLQIYFDFSGYSDMAIGIGMLLGFTTEENFNYPYRSLSVQEFWRRWHISLSGWFRDYVYFPLGGSRCALPRICLNTLIVFFLTGLWHGANWTFIAWGLYYAVFLILERTALKQVLAKLPAAIRWLYTVFVVNIGWILFRSSDLNAAFRMIAGLFRNGEGVQIRMQLASLLPLSAVAALVLGVVFSFPVWKVFREKLAAKAPWLYHAIVIVVFGIALCFLAGRGFSPFLYMQF